MLNSARIGLFLIVCFSLLGCRRAKEAEIVLTVVTRATVLVTRTEQPVKTLVPTSTAEQSVVASPSEPDQDDHSSVLPPPIHEDRADEEIADLHQWLLDAWQNGSEFSDVSKSLISAGWSEIGMVQSIDYDQDGISEWFIEYTHPEIECFHDWVGLPCGGDILMIGDGGIEYRFSAEVDPDFDYQWGPIGTVTRFKDTSDFFLVIQTGGCGAHTCWDDFTILKSDNGKLVSAVEYPQDPAEWGSQILYWHPADSDRPINMTYAEHAIIDVNGDGRDELVLEGGWVGSGGSGFQRERTETWGWTGTDVGLIDLIWHPTELSLHLLREAGDLVGMGRYDGAKELYEELAGRIDGEDEDKLGQADPYHVAFFSAFRLAHLGYLQKDGDMIQKWVDWIGQTDPTHPMSAGGSVLREQWEEGRSVEEACSAVINHLSQIDGVEAFLPIEYGYANPPIELGNLCPLID